MARHRWATGEQTSGPDRLERVLNLSAGAQEDADRGGSRVGFIDEGETRAAGFGIPLSRSGRRWAATRRAALVAAGCALAVGGWQFVSADRDTTEVVPIERSTAGATEVQGDTNPGDQRPEPPQEGTASPAEGSEPDAARTGTALVHVAGAVKSPGVVEVAAGARVFEALERAGGALPEAELSSVNLAAVVQDGQQLLIPRAGEPSVTGAPPAPASGAASGAGGPLVNLNSADAAELEQLPRVGPVLAERIIEWREDHGSFTNPADLDAVPGIGPAMLESLLPLVTV